jgi:hypothetical protein
MLRDPRPVEKSQVAREGKPEARLRLVKLEERIAPTLHTNPQGNQVGNTNKHGHGGFV